MLKTVTKSCLCYAYNKNTPLIPPDRTTQDKKNISSSIFYTYPGMDERLTPANEEENLVFDARKKNYKKRSERRQENQNNTLKYSFYILQ